MKTNHRQAFIVDLSFENVSATQNSSALSSRTYYPTCTTAVLCTLKTPGFDKSCTTSVKYGMFGVFCTFLGSTNCTVF